MVAAAEALKRQTHEFDWELAEVQLSEMANYQRPPETEIYGRSLSTIHRLGIFMVGKAAAEAAHSPEADQARVEFYTSVEEGFGTDMELGGGLEVRDFDTRAVIAGRVMAKDLETPVSDMTYAGLVCAEKKAKNDKHFLPQLIRTRWDHENALTVDKMVKGETDYNTRIVISPFPEEAAARSGNDYWQGIGYVPHLRRGFVQLYHTNGEAITGSLSFDGSNKERLREIFARHDVEIPENEVTDNWLQYAITDTLPEDQAKALALEIADEAGDPMYKKTTNTVDVTSEHKTIMDTVFNESYIHACESHARGHQTADAQKLIFQLANKADDFNDRYKEALYRMRADGSRFTDDDMIVVHELLVYSAVEMMRALHLRKTQPADHGSNVYQSSRLDVAYLQSLDAQAFQHMLSGFGADGARNNRTYSACGLAISPGSGQSDMNKQEAFGGVDSKSESKTSEMKCVNCPACSTFHEKVRTVNGKPVCDNKKCKLYG